MTKLRLILLPLLLMGCAAALQPRESLLLQQSRFGELQQLMESRIADPAHAPTQELFFLCYSYSRVKHYEKLFACLPHLAANIARGDKMLYGVFDFSAAPALMEAEARMELRELERAVTLAEEAVRLTTPPESYLQMRLYALTAAGLVHALRGETTEARAHLQTLSGVETGFNQMAATDKWLGMARLHMALGEPREALAALDRDAANAGFTALADLVSGAALTGTSLFTYWELPKRFLRARALLESDSADEARRLYQALLALPATADNGEIHWMTLADLGRIALASGDTETAVAHLEQAAAVIEAERASIATEVGKLGFFGDKETVYAGLVQAYLARGDTARAFASAERSKGRALVEMLAARDLSAPAPTRAAYEALRQGSLRLRIQDTDRTPEETGRLRREVDGAARQIARNAPDFAELVTVPLPEASRIQASLGPREMMLLYHGQGEKLWLFAVDRQEVRVFPLAGAGLLRDVVALRRAVQTPDGAWREVSRALYRRLIEPAEGVLAGKTPVIVPHGPLYYLPFAALWDGRAFFGERFPLRFLPSAMAGLHLHRPSSGGGMLVLGNPDLGDPSLDLPAAGEEAALIGREWPEARVLARQAATESAVKSLAGGVSRLHLAAHGRFDPEEPLASGIELVPGGGEDGRLTVAELYDLRLSAPLVVLSACDTALGRLAAGDELVGLTRGFLHAGAAEVVSSLWSVEDRATAVLMARFHRQRGSASEALREAQREVRRQFGEHPFFWAAFQVTGS